MGYDDEELATMMKRTRLEGYDRGLKDGKQISVVILAEEISKIKTDRYESGPVLYRILDELQAKVTAFCILGLAHGCGSTNPGNLRPDTVSDDQTK